MKLFTKKGRTPAEVNADIRALHDSIAAKESAIGVIEEQVRAAVASGDMQAADALDTDLVREQMSLERLRSRSAILADALAAAEDEAANLAAQSLHDKAKAAQAIGHALLSDYEKQAKGLADTLGKLAAIDRYIDRANDKTEGRADPIESAYAATRHRPAIMADGIARWYEYPGHGPVHPDLDPWLSIDGDSYSRRAPEPLHVGDNERGEPIYVEAVLMSRTAPNAIVVEQRGYERPIDEMARLPGCRVGDADLWGETQRRAAHERAQETVDALLAGKRKAA